MSCTGLHETVIKDIMDTIKDGINQAEDIGFNVRSSTSIRTASSLSKATEGLVLVFPHLCSENTSPETASMLTRAIETKAVTLLQIAFSAFNITNSKDAVDFVKQFHTNVKSGKMSIDGFIDAMDSVSETSTIVSRNQIRAVLEDFKNMTYYFENDISETSINDYKVINRYGKYIIGEAVLQEAPRDTGNTFYKQGWKDANDDWQKRQSGRDLGVKIANSRENRRHNEREEDLKSQQLQNSKDNSDRSYDLDSKKFEDKKDKDKRDEEYKKERDKVRDGQWDSDYNLKQQDIANKQLKDDFDMLRQQILPTDVKKANDMVPTMMIINFNVRDEELKTITRSQAIIGVKAKLYPASSNDIINKIIVKNADNNWILKLMRVSTRELSFVKDFLFAIDDAKLAAVSCSIKGSDTNKMLKVLERRALKGKIRKRLNMNNAYKAITTLTITREEADFIKKYNNIDVFNTSIIRQIMESLNLMMVIIADDTEECAYIIMDSGDDTYERISYTHLERDSADGSYKKAINLMTKVVR